MKNPAIQRVCSPAARFVMVALSLVHVLAGCGVVDTAQLPEVPTLVAPVNGSASEPDVLELQWNSATEAETYHLQVASDPSFSALIVDDEALNSIQYIVRDLEVGAIYYWRIRSSNGSGYSDWSETRQFKPASAALPPAIPQLISPLSGVGDMPSDIYFEWDDVAGASTYHIQVSLEENFLRRSADLDGIRGERVLIRELVPTYIYWWRVRSVNPLGVSAWSEVRVLEIHDLAQDLPTS
ncbi:MAG: fibronectin type III domain-containing protein [Rhodothermales bacterium]|nr:fibronectin type III domain-containing protein [Rhodothermales bacterium]